MKPWELSNSDFEEWFNHIIQPVETYRLVLLDSVESGLGLEMAKVKAEFAIMDAGASCWATVHKPNCIEYWVDELNEGLREELFATIEREEAAAQNAA